MADASRPAAAAPRRSHFRWLPFPLAAATLAGFAGRWHWLLDLASHFRWYWLMLALLAIAVCWRRGGPAVRCCLAVALLGNAGPLLPYWLPPTAGGAAVASPPRPTASESCGLIVINVLARNAAKSAVVEYLRSRDPDFIVALEIDAAWAQALAGLGDRWPHGIIHSQDDNFGIALLAKRPPQEQAVREFGAAGVPSIVATFTGASGPFTLVATHPLAPQSAGTACRRDAHLRALADFVAASPLPCVVAGDLNATPWSAAFRDLVARTGLVDTARGFGVQSTWNARLWAPRIPIDHVLVPPGTEVLRRAVGPDVGSDHFPVEADIRLPAAR